MVSPTTRSQVFRGPQMPLPPPGAEGPPKRPPKRPTGSADRFDASPALGKASGRGHLLEPRPEVIARIEELYRQLSRATSLEPSPQTNALFTELVGLTYGADPWLSQTTLTHPRIKELLPHLRELCAKGEGLLEHHWFDRIHGSDDAARALESFPYYENYVDLTRLEVQSMGIAGDLPKKVLFIGSGSLPLTSILLARDYGISVDNIDIDPRAAKEGEALARDLGLGPELLSFAHTDVTGLSAEQLGRYDTFYVAALAGLEAHDKNQIFDRISQHARPGATILARSAHRLRSLLYPPVEPEDLRGFEPQVVVHPFTDVVNSVVVARKATGDT